MNADEHDAMSRPFLYGANLIPDDLEETAVFDGVDRIILGFMAHEVAHELWVAGRSERAVRCLEIASRCDIAEAEHDLMELEYTGGEHIATCADVMPVASEPSPADPPATADRPGRHRRGLRAWLPGWIRRPALVPAMSGLGAALLVGIPLVAVRTAPQVVTPQVGAPPGAAMPVPVNLTTVPAEKASRLRWTDPRSSPPTRPPLSAESRPPVAAVSPSPAPPPGPSAPASTPRQDKLYNVVGKVDSDGVVVTAIAPEGDGQQRQIRLKAIPNSLFVATLSSGDRYACTWWFSGTNAAGTETLAATERVAVPADERVGIKFQVYDWPVLLAEVTSEQPDRCLLVGHRFDPLESTREPGGTDPPPVASPTAAPSPSPSPSPSLAPPVRISGGL